MPGNRLVVVVLYALVAGSCAWTDPSPRLKALKAQAEWLSEAFGAKAARAQEKKAAHTDDLRWSVLEPVYAQASDDLAELVDLLSVESAEAGLHTREGIEKVECQLRAIEKTVGDAEKLMDRGSAAIVALSALEQHLREAKTKAQEAEDDAPPEKKKSLQAATNRAEDRLTQASDALWKLRAAKREDAQSLVVAAETALQELRSAGNKQDPVEHARLQTQLEGDVAKVSSRLDAERKKKADSSRVRRLERALGQLKGAQAIIVDKAGNKIDDSGTLADASAQRDKAHALLAEVDADIVLHTSPWFRAHAGAITVSPYVMRKTNGSVPSSTAPQGGKFVLEKVANPTSFYAEVDFLILRASLDPENIVDRDEGLGVTFLPEWLTPDDHEIRLRFANANEIDSGATAAGGDWAAEASIGWNLLAFGLKSHALCEQQPELKKRPQGTFNLEMNGGLVTDRDALDSHLFAQAGLASAWSFPMQVDDDVWRTATVFMGLYYGVSESRSSTAMTTST